MTKEQEKALAMDLCRIIKHLSHEIISAIGDNRVLICIQPHAGICADINGSKYLVNWTDTYEKSETNN